jgi:hypothetical protein
MTTNQGLAEQIEQLVRNHLAAVGAAVERVASASSTIAFTPVMQAR